MGDVKKMLATYADDELKEYLQQGNGQHAEGDNVAVLRNRPKFKYVDGVERLSDMPLPFLVDLPNGSSEAVFLIASKNSACGVVPITE